MVSGGHGKGGGLDATEPSDTSNLYSMVIPMDYLLIASTKE